MGTRHARLRVLAPVVVLLALAGSGALAGCGPADQAATPAAATTPPTGPRTVSVALNGRPFLLHIPTGYHQGTAVPLVVMLHGYTSSAAGEEGYLKITAESDKRGFLYATPDGTAESGGNRFWNATDACCNLYSSKVDDSGYLSSLITTVQQQYTVDAKRVYLIGHSNGAFMAYRFACDHADQVTAIVSLAGAMWNDISKCSPKRPVSVLEVHGTADERISFNGDLIAGNAFPSVATTLADWRTLDGCTDTANTTTAPMDLVSNLDGAETSVTIYATGCKANTTVDLWTIKAGPHVPMFTPAFAAAAADFLLGQVAA